MARSIADIQASIILNAQAQPELAAANSTSHRAIWRLWAFVVAVAINLLEQILDLFRIEIEQSVAASAAASNVWLQAKMLQFQYSATNPQIIQLINLVPTYPVVDNSLQIITACSVTSDVSNSVTIKVAKGNPFVALNTLEIASAQGYINTIGIAGIQYIVKSQNADKIFVDADIYFAGQYASIIQTNVIAAINSFLQNLSALNFDGSLKLIDLEIAIRQVPGVNDVVLNNVRCRADADAFASGVDLVLGNTLLLSKFKTISGYIVGETTVTKTFFDTLNFIPQ